MNRFRAFLRKEFYHIVRDTRTLILIVVMPILLVLLFGFAITREIRDADIAILDHSKDAATKAITDKLLSSRYFRLHSYLQSSKELEDVFKSGEIKLAVIFPPQFAKDLARHGDGGIQIIADATDPNIGNTLRNYVQAIIRDYQAGQSHGFDPPYRIQTEVQMLYNPQLESAFYFVPGVITIIITLISAMMTSVTIAREKEFGTMEILLVSPLKPHLIIFGKSLPYLIIAMINTMSVIYLGYAVFGMPISGSFLLLFGECLLFVLNTLALGLLISSRVKTQRIALMISLIGLFLPTMLLSNFIFPLESMPDILQWIAKAVPARWFVIILKSVMLKGVGLEMIWMETLILAAMTAIFLGISIKGFKIRME